MTPDDPVENVKAENKELFYEGFAFCLNLIHRGMKNGLNLKDAFLCAEKSFEIILEEEINKLNVKKGIK